jgi:O-antigen/teichoic acid export membrane protein
MNVAAPTAPPTSTRVPPTRAQTRRELKRGAFLNAAAMLASNFRAIFTLLIARLLGPIALGIFSVAWATTDLVSKIGICGLDDAVMTFVARAEAAGDRLRSRFLFRLANIVAVAQSTIVALILSLGVRKIGHAIGLQPEMNSAFAVIVWALPGIALYRISTSVSRGAKVMEHDIYSRGFTEPGITIIAFVVALAFGSGAFAPEVAAIVGSFAAGIVAFILASGLFRRLPSFGGLRVGEEAKKLLGYALPIGADQFLNAFIWRVDVIILGYFVGRAPGVTLTTLGIYGAVVGLANGLRRVSQPFTPIFTPVVAGMTATGEHREAAATYARLLQWMLWILLPFTAVMVIAGDTILMVYGPAFQQGGRWLAVVAIACATNAFINLGETVIMVQRPGLNLLNSLITAAVGASATFYLIPRLGVMGAAFGILITYTVQGAIRTVILWLVFHWESPWNEIRPVVFAAVLAIVPAVICRLYFPGIAGQIGGALLCLGLFTGSWFYYRRTQNQIE